MKSLSFSRNATVKYKAKETPKVAKLIYIKNNLTFFARIPRRSANLEETSKPCFSKKYFTSLITAIINLQSSDF
tara:strand:+ start:733 stop:954 length:222 start_codon:yes stop_codon:yes gene_type:complete